MGNTLQQRARRCVVAAALLAVFAIGLPREALAVDYKVRITGAGRVYDHLEIKRMDCWSPIWTAEGSGGVVCDADYPNAWGITFTAAARDGWEFEGWKGTGFGLANVGSLHCDFADESHWLPASKPPSRPYPSICTFGTSVGGDPDWGVEARFIDVRDPETEITSGTTGRTGPNASVRWTFKEPDSVWEGSSFECQFDGAGWDPCASGQMYSNTPLAAGGHTFYVRARDPSGRHDGTPASQSWFIDRQPPTTTIDTGPASPTVSNTAQFSFSLSHTAGDAGGSFECKLDAGAWASCGSGESGIAGRTVAEGAHRFYVRAADVYGNVDQTPAEWAWIVDTGAPETTISSGPANGARTASRTATFGLESENGATFACKLDGGSFTACSGPGNFHTAAGLADGPHTVEVRATDAVGNIDPSPAARTWTVDTTPPDTAITGGPASGAVIYARTASFSFASEPNASFECRFDGSAFAPCGHAGSHTVAGLAPGAHRLEVRAVDAVGNRDASPAARAFVVAFPSVAISRATMATRWKQSILKNARLRLSGTLAGGHPGQLRIVFAGGTVVAAVPAGNFSVTVRLPRAIRSSTLPGPTTFQITGTSNRLPISATTHNVRVSAPPEGVVMTAHMSTSSKGRPLTRISSARKLWATFRFAPDGQPKRAIRAHWFRNGKRLGDSPAAPPNAFSRYRRTASLPKGRYSCALKMGKKVIKTVSVRVG